MLFERFGFLLACVLTLLFLLVIFLNSDWLLREPARSAEDGAVAAGQEEVAAAAAVANVARLSIETTPAGATVMVDDEPVGVSPLLEYALPDGVYRLSLRKEAYATFDTVVTLAGAPARLRLALQPFAPDVEEQAGQADVPETPPATVAETPPEQPAQPAPQTQTPPSDARQADKAARPSDAANPPTPVPEADEAPAPPAVGVLQVTSQPSGASVLLGDRQIGVTPLVYQDAPAGTQQITLRLDGYEDFTATVTVAPEQTSEVNGRLTQRLGTLKILAKPWGTIYIDGDLKKSETNIWYTVQLPPGIHRVRVEHPALGKWENRVSVVAGKEEEVVVDFNAQGRQQN